MYGDILEYIKSLREINPILSAFVGGVFSLFFPEQSFFMAAGAVMILAVIDVLTKYYALAMVDSS